MERLNKKEWVTVVQWLKLRFSAIKWNDAEIRALYEDFKMYDADLIWAVVNMAYENNTDFFNASKMKAMCKEHETHHSNVPELTMGEVMQKNSGGLIEYLEVNQYESFAHAVWHAFIKRLRSGGALKTDPTDWDLEQSWEEAKPRWLATFKPEWKLSVLKEKRDSRRDTKHGIE